jgi:hypothetical protein
MCVGAFGLLIRGTTSSAISDSGPSNRSRIVTIWIFA